MFHTTSKILQTHHVVARDYVEIVTQTTAKINFDACLRALATMLIMDNIFWNIDRLQKTSVNKTRHSFMLAGM